MNIYELSSIGAGTLTSILILWGGHYFRWERLLGREMHRLEAYTYGTAAMFAGFALIAYLMAGRAVAPFNAVIWLFCVNLGSGLGVIGFYALDAWMLRLAANRRLARKGKLKDVSEQ